MKPMSQMHHITRVNILNRLSGDSCLHLDLLAFVSKCALFLYFVTVNFYPVTKYRSPIQYRIHITVLKM